jgi:hypothetical protein
LPTIPFSANNGVEKHCEIDESVARPRAILLRRFIEFARVFGDFGGNVVALWQRLP